MSEVMQSDLDLYPDEANQIKLIWAELQRRFSGKADTRENLLAMATEAENRFREVGFELNIDLGNMELEDSVVPKLHVPEVNVELKAHFSKPVFGLCGHC